LTEQSKVNLIKDLEKTNFKCIFCFNNPSKITSILMGQIIYFWNIVKQNKGCMAIVSKDQKLKVSFELCSLNRIVRMFDSIKEAEHYVEHTQVMQIQ